MAKKLAVLQKFPRFLVHHCKCFMCFVFDLFDQSSEAPYYSFAWYAPASTGFYSVG